jgi:hypothetical protein
MAFSDYLNYEKAIIAERNQAIVNWPKNSWSAPSRTILAEAAYDNYQIRHRSHQNQ